MIGAQPFTDWLPAEIERDDRGYLRTGVDLVNQRSVVGGWPLTRAPMTHETSLPGVFAIGDVRHGSTKRVASGAGEGSVVVTELHRLVQPAPLDRHSIATRVEPRPTVGWLLPE